MSGTVLGRRVAVGDCIAFTPGGNPIRFARIDPARHEHAALGMSYRLAYDFAGIGYTLFDESPVWLATEEFDEFDCTDECPDDCMADHRGES